MLHIWLYSLTKLLTLTSIETHSAIICTSIPTLRPLVRRYFSSALAVDKTETPMDVHLSSYVSTSGASDGPISPTFRSNGSNPPSGTCASFSSISISKRPEVTDTYVPVLDEVCTNVESGLYGKHSEKTFAGSSYQLPAIRSLSSATLRFESPEGIFNDLSRQEAYGTKQ